MLHILFYSLDFTWIHFYLLVVIHDPLVLTLHGCSFPGVLTTYPDVLSPLLAEISAGKTTVTSPELASISGHFGLAEALTCSVLVRFLKRA